MDPRKIGAVIAALALAAPAAAKGGAGDGNFYVRNDTKLTLICVVSRDRSAAQQEVVLSPGQEWSLKGDKAKVRRIACEPTARPQRYRLESGRRYRLTVDEGGYVRVGGL